MYDLCTFLYLITILKEKINGFWITHRLSRGLEVGREREPDLRQCPS